jgi:hypothetical protein
MTPQEALQQHAQICDELYALALEENRFLHQYQRPPDAPLLDRKRALLARVDEALAALRSAPRGGAREPALRAALDKTRSRILQILQLDRENEQLLTRFSLSRGPVQAAPAVPAGMLQKIYARHTVE